MKFAMLRSMPRLAGCSARPYVPSAAATAPLHKRCCSSGAGVKPPTSDSDEPATKQQLAQLGLVSGLPFIGFGIMDNAIMILAGDAIDASLGARLGVSTMAAAALGNTFSNCCGLWAGDWIESLCLRFGIRQPPLTDHQRDSKAARIWKFSATVLCVVTGCLIGMFPLLFKTDRKHLYFTDEQEHLYETVFQPHAISLHLFFELMSAATWHHANAGNVIISEGVPLDSVVMLYSGNAISTDSAGQSVFSYRGRCNNSDAGSQWESQWDAGDVAVGAKLRGCVIGGTAFLDHHVNSEANKKYHCDDAYPFEVTAAVPLQYVTWGKAELEEIMRGDKAIELAILSILYSDLLESTRRNARNELEAATSNAERPVKRSTTVRSSQALRDYRVLVGMAVADEIVHPSEKKLCEEFRVRKGISEEESWKVVADEGWTAEEWTAGYKERAPEKDLVERMTWLSRSSTRRKK